MHLACKAPFKEGINNFCGYLIRSIGKTNVRVILGKAVSPEEILSQKPDAVIIATGSKPCLPRIPGIDLPFVFNVRSAYDRTSVLPGVNIIIIGAGDIGCETADMLSSQSKKVTIVELCNEPLMRMKEIPRQELINRLKEKGVSIITTCKVTAVEYGKVLIEDKSGQVKELKADSVVVSVGSIPENSLHDVLKDKIKEIYTIVDAKEPGNIGKALRSATEVGVKL